MEYHNVDENHASFHDYTLILPSVSVGNVGQLACDLLISTLKLKKRGYLWTTCVLPVVGPDPFVTDTNTITLCLEVFVDDDRQLAILQQRAPVVTGKQQEFSEQLVYWISKAKFSQVIMITSCHAYERRDNELEGNPVRYLIGSNCEKLEDTLKNMQLKKLSKRKTEYGEELYYMPGGGIAKRFYEECSTTSRSFATVLLMTFCSEGDNTPEAIEMAGILNSWKKYLPQKKSNSQWIFPSSWKFLFGNRQPSSIF